MRGELTGESYDAFARVYDRLVGDAWFPTIRRSFESLVRDYGISFQSAADLGCGTGTFVRYLRRHVPVVYGVDRAPVMLRIAVEKTRGSGVRLLRQDLAAMRLPRRVDLVTCNFDTLNYILSVGRLGRVFSRCRANLVRGGHFIYDVILAPRHVRTQQTEAYVLKGPGMVARWVVWWNARERRSRVDMRYWLQSGSGQWRRTSEVHVQRWYSLPELFGVLKPAGFALRGAHDMETLGHATGRTAWAKCVVVAV